MVLSEGGEEIGRFTLRDINNGEWDADFRTSEDSIGFAGFVAWIVRAWRLGTTRL